MRRAAIALSLVLLPAMAEAGWGTAVSVPGVPFDVDVGDAGAPEWIGVSSDAGGFSVVNSVVGPAVVPSGGSAIAVVFDHSLGCIGAVPPGVVGCTITWQAPCVGADPGQSGYSLTCLRGRQLGDAGFLLSKPGGTPQAFLLYSPTAGTGAGAGWEYGISNFSTTDGIGVGVEHVGGNDLASMFGTQAGAPTLSVYDTTPNTLLTQTVSGVATMGDMELLGGATWVLYTSGASLAWVPVDGGTTMTPTTIALPPGVTAVSGLSFQEATDPISDAGFGMLSVAYADGGFDILSAVPDPANPAGIWLPSTAQPTGLAGAFGHLRCEAGRVCGLVTDAGGSANLGVYHNAAVPTVPVTTFSYVSGMQTFFLDAGDLDGDAIFLTWSPDGGSPLGLTVLYPNDPEGRLVQVTAGALSCASVSSHYTVVASDGLHETTQTVTFISDGGSGGGVPVISDGGFIALQAGGAGATVGITVDAGACTSGGVTVVNGTVPVPVDAGFNPGTGTFTVTPPADWCSSQPGIDTFIVQVDGGGSATIQVTVDPWGIPYAPFAPNQTFSQNEGTTQMYSPAFTHPCAAASGFPGVTTSWEWDAGDTRFSVTPMGVPPVQATAISVTLNDCEPNRTNAPFVVTNVTNDGSGEADAGTIFITPMLNFPPLSAPTVTGAEVNVGSNVEIDAGAHTGDRCPRLQGMTANFDFLLGGVLTQTTNGVPVDDAGNASTLFQFTPGCSGGVYSVTATISLDDGGLSPQGKFGPVTAPPLAPFVAFIDAGNSFKAYCGQPATGGAMIATAGSAASGQCPNPSWTWFQGNVQDGGPQLLIQVLNDAGLTSAVTFQTTASAFAFIGQPVTLTAQANVGSSSAQLSAQETIGVDHFVTVTHATDTAQPEALSLFGVSVTLFNATTCDVSGVEFDETTTNMEAIPGSARIQGVPADVASSPNQLTFTGISLPAQSKVTLTYSARPNLLVGPAPSGTAYLNGVQISDTSSLPKAPTGCGCSDVSGLWSGFLLLLLGAARRRRARA